MLSTRTSTIESLIYHTIQQNNNLGENRVETSFVQYPSAWLGKNDKATFTKVSLLSQFEYAPPTRQIHLGQYVAWWNVITFGTGTRCTQIAVYGFNIHSHNTVYIRRQHDNEVSEWVRVTTERDVVQNTFNLIYNGNGTNQDFEFDMPVGSSKIISCDITMVSSTWEFKLYHISSFINVNKIHFDFSADVNQVYAVRVTFGI